MKDSIRIDYFLNDDFKVLKALCENEVLTDVTSFVKLSQDDLATLTGMSKTKVNGILKGLTEGGFVAMKSKGRYCLSQEARAIYESVMGDLGGEKDE